MIHVAVTTRSAGMPVTRARSLLLSAIARIAVPSFVRWSMKCIASMSPIAATTMVSS